MKMVDVIQKVMLNLGGDALYQDLYGEIARVQRRALSNNNEGYVRQVVEEHSEDSRIDANRKKATIFYSVGGLGSGHWGPDRGRYLIAAVNIGSPSMGQVVR